MKKIKRVLALCLTFGFLFTACSKPAEKKNEQTETKNETRVFKDDLGREVTLKQNITRVAPSGNPAQVMLHIYEPNKLVGIASKFSKSTEKYISEDLKKLPEFGAFYGKKANLRDFDFFSFSPPANIAIETIHSDKIMLTVFFILHPPCLTEYARPCFT